MEDIAVAECRVVLHKFYLSIYIAHVVYISLKIEDILGLYLERLRA